ncbi:hypothetical protein [Aureimonas pseudogalii]|uniref:Uncharacterized protein n=1 Tax=Aureimonas pseudogalii TaxID=1744844 RepID=A0A7W6H730_9HYPH|nr:hypothetical protein [Aureimonas pseudogalii]MBB3999815.1 hypothetical protein [Aureimonas pseudogalii]
MPHPQGDASRQCGGPPTPPVPPALKASALRGSAWQRLAAVALPVACLWIAVALALDLFA